MPTDEAIELTKRLVSMESVSGGEREVMEFARDYFEDHDVPVVLDSFSAGGTDRCNVEVGDPAEADLLVSAHLDTVNFDVDAWDRDPLDPAVEDGKLYGRGSVDTKSNAAAAMVATKDAFASGNPDIALVLESDEEAQFRGAERFLSKYDPTDVSPELVLICEPTDLKVVTEHNGLYHARIRVVGSVPDRHASAAQMVEGGEVRQRGTPAIRKSVPVLSVLDDFREEMATLPPDDRLGPVTFAVTMVDGGTDTNSLPVSCEIVTDSRVPPNHDPGDLADHLQARLQPVLDRADNVSVFAVHDAVRVDRDSQSVERFRALTESAGGPGTFDAKPAFTELALYVHRLDVPGVIFGTGPVAQTHAADEYVSVDTIGVVHEAYAAAVSRFG